MKEIITMKILRKVLILTFLIAGLVFIASSNKTTESVYARMCCYDCEYHIQSVIENTCTPGDYQCEANVRYEYRWCTNHCDYSSCQIYCGDTGACPVGLSCNGQYCAEF